MMLLGQDRIQRSSDTAAMVLSAGVLALLFIAKAHSSLEAVPPPPGTDQSSIEVSLQTPAAVTPPPAPPVPPPKALPHHVVPQRLQAAEIPVPADPLPAKTEAAPVPDGAALVAAAASPAPAAAHTRPDLEAEYAAGLRADIDRRTRPPDSAQYRLRHPSGEVRVGFVVMRSGETKAIRLLRSSGSSLLDQTAQTIVASGHYPPIPVEAFTGEQEHLFAVTIEFRPAS